jgi:hypothetical protein
MLFCDRQHSAGLGEGEDAAVDLVVGLQLILALDLPPVLNMDDSLLLLVDEYIPPVDLTGADEGLGPDPLPSEFERDSLLRAGDVQIGRAAKGVALVW